MANDNELDTRKENSLTKMNKFITLHRKDDNGLIGINLDSVKVIFDKNDYSVCYTYYDVDHSLVSFNVNESVSQIYKKLQTAKQDSDFVVLHGERTNNAFILAISTIGYLATASNGKTIIAFSHDIKNTITANESITRIMEAIGK